MINRYKAICNSCNETFIFRAVVPLATTEDFCFGCPNCNIKLIGELELDYQVPKMLIKPLGFELTEEWLPEGNHHVITMATDLPVHRDKHKNTLDKGGSPFLWLMVKMEESFMKWKEKVDYLQSIRHDRLALIKTIVNYAEMRAWDKVKEMLSPEVLTKSSSEMETIYSFNRFLSTFYLPLIPIDNMMEIMDDYYPHLNNCRNNHLETYKSLLEGFVNTFGYNNFRIKLFNTFVRVLERYDAFIVGNLYEQMPHSLQSDINSYRIFRNDYDLVKGLFQDIFELNIHSLIFVATILNLSCRSDPSHFYDGSTNCNRFLRKVAFKKLEILNELPIVEKLLLEVSRTMRNKIGHFSANYNYLTGNVVYDDGTEMNYIEFLGHFSRSIKSLWFLLILTEKCDLEMSDLRIIE